MIARPIKTARSWQILHEIGQILSHQYRERTFVSVVLIGLTLTCDVSREKYRTCKGRRAAEPTEDLDARKMEAFQLNTKKRKKHKM